MLPRLDERGQLLLLVEARARRRERGDEHHRQRVLTVGACASFVRDGVEAHARGGERAALHLHALGERVRGLAAAALRDELAAARLDARRSTIQSAPHVRLLELAIERRLITRAGGDLERLRGGDGVGLGRHLLLHGAGEVRVDAERLLEVPTELGLEGRGRDAADDHA